MPPILEPTFVFELQAPPDAIPGGRITEPGLMFAGSPPMLYVAEPVWNATWGRWFSWHSPTIAASVFLATLLMTVWWMRRVGKRPRQVGRMYCRVCNHQLAKPQLKLNEKKRAVWADAESKCPECGVRHKRGPVRGRLRFTRMLPVLLVSPVVLFVCALVMLATLRFHQRSAWGGGTWPVVGMEKVFGAWALERRGIGIDSNSTRLWRIDPRTGAKELIGPIDSWTLSYLEFVSSDGRFVVAPVMNGRRMLVIDLKSGKRVEYSAGDEGFSYLAMRRFSIDGSRVFVERTTYRGSSMLHELTTFDPATGKFEVIASVELPPENSKAGTYGARKFEFREVAGGIAWIQTSGLRSATGRGEELTVRWENGGKLMKRTEISTSGSLHLELSDDGTACIVSDAMARSSRAFDLKTGEDLATAPSAGMEQDRDRAGPRMPGFVNNGVMTIMSLKGVPRVVGELSVTKQFSPAIGSADGRFVSAWKERDVAPSWIAAMLGAPPTKVPNVLVWDFEKLLDAETEEPIGVRK